MGRLRWAWRGAAALLLLCACSLLSHASEEALYGFLQQASPPILFGSETFDYDGTDICRIVIPPYLLESCDESTRSVRPGQRDPAVEEVKLHLNSNDVFPKNEFVTYTQVRPEVVDYFDEHLALFFETLYRFAGLEGKEPVLDGITYYLAMNLQNLSYPLRNDIEVAYKYAMVQNNTQGTILRDGTADHIYYFAQTDPDWADEIFEFEGNGATLRDRGCGTACAAMVFSTYHKVEITPKWMRHYALDGDWQVSYGLPNEYFLGIASYYTYLETERYGTVLQQPRIYTKSEFNMDTLIDQIQNQGYMAIIHVVAGAFTSQEHYMVLMDYRVIDGQGYFLVADPYEMPSRYRDTDQMRDVPGDNQGLVYATPDLLYRDCKSIILFEQDRNEFSLCSKAPHAERVDQKHEGGTNA